MKAIIIYKSDTGFTQRYAKWIAEELSCEAVPLENIKSVELSSYDAIVFGGWLFAGSIKGLKEFKKQLPSFKGKTAVFATGATPPNAPRAAQLINNCFTEEEHKRIGTFYLHGGLDYGQMGFINKSMMKMLCSVMKKQKGVDSEEYKAVSRSFDATNKASINPLVQYIKG